MNKIFQLSLVIALIIVFTGCKSGPKPLYNWGDYVNSSTNFGVNGHEKETLEKHLTELETIINDSESSDMRVAPGIYAEYAQMLFETNKKTKAKKYFILEQQTYPESTEFINRVMTKLYGDVK